MDRMPLSRMRRQIASPFVFAPTHIAPLRQLTERDTKHKQGRRPWISRITTRQVANSELIRSIGTIPLYRIDQANIIQHLRNKQTTWSHFGKHQLYHTAITNQKQHTAMLRRTTSFIPLPRLVSYARQSRPVATQSNATSCALDHVVDLAQKAVKRSCTPKILKPWFRKSQSPCPTLSPSELTELENMVKSIDLSDFNISAEEFINMDVPEERREPLKKRFQSGAVAFMSVCERPDVTMAIFVLPPGGCLPIHDHSQMFVVSRVLFGVLEVASFDLLQAQRDRQFVAKYRPVEVLKQGEVSSLTPERANVHSFHAKEWTAVFDVLLPPYSGREGRDCNYYQEIEPAPDGNVILKVCFASL